MLYTDTMIVTTSPLPPIENYGWDEWKFLEDPQRAKNNLSAGAFEYRLPNGKGIRYNTDGSFNTVLNPKLKK